MNNTTIETNADKVYNAFRELSTKEMRKALKSALQQASGKLRSETKKTMRTMLPAARQRSTKYEDTLLDAVKRSKVEENRNGEMSVKVHIMGVRTTGSGTFRAKFFEKGTNNRRTAKGYNRGIIKPLGFFNTTTISFANQYNTTLNDAISKAIDKINKAKK